MGIMTITTSVPEDNRIATAFGNQFSLPGPASPAQDRAGRRDEAGCDSRTGWCHVDFANLIAP